MDLIKIENELIFLYNAIEVDIDFDGVFATFIWDEFNETACNVIKSYLAFNANLKDVDYEEMGDSSWVVYGFFNDIENEYPEDIEQMELVSDSEEIVTERKTVVKVNHKGKRRRKVVCGKGKKWDGKRCVAMSGSQKLAIKKGRIKAKRTNKAKGTGKKRRTAMLRKRAMKRRGK